MVSQDRDWGWDLGQATHNVLLKSLDEPKVFNDVECITVTTGRSMVLKWTSSCRTHSNESAVHSRLLFLSVRIISFT